MQQINLEELQENISDMRRKLGISTWRLQQSGISNQTYQRIEGGNLSNVTVGSLVKYMQCLGYQIKNDLPIRFEKIERVYPDGVL